MRMYVKVMAAVIACILLSGEAYSALATTPATENLSWFKKKKKKNSEEERVKSDYEKLVEGSSVKKGMFAVYQKKNDYYFEVPTSLLGRDLLVVNKLQRVPAELNDAGVNRGVNYENQMICMEWDKATGKLMFRQQRPLPLAPQTDAIFRSVKDNFISPLIAAFKIEAVNQDSTALVIKINDIYDGTETSINNVFTNINLGTSAIKNLSRILSVKSFPNNVVATSELTTKVTEGTTSVYVTVEVSSSILLLPETPMMGRFDNQKIGYFTNPLLSFSDAQQRTDKKQFITRWRMEPKPEDREAYLKGKVVEPAKPIVFYIDNSTPYQWRKYIKRGIEDWQIAFEKAGFKNAIIAIEVTDSMEIDMDDVNYSVLTYAASEKKNAMGPSLLDPRSGEILEADIMWWHNVLSMVSEWITVQTGTVCPEARSVQLPDSLLGDAIRFVACHEVGHSLGLRHNMMGSAAFPTDSLRSATFTSRLNSTASSIMDYARNNYIAQPGDKERGVRLTPPELGAYDYYAISWLYSPIFEAKTAEEEIPILDKWISEKSGDVKYRYGKQQFRRRFDPSSVEEDLGDDPVKASEYGRRNLQYLLKHINDWVADKDKDFEFRTAVYDEIVYAYVRYLTFVLGDIGGIYLNERYDGDQRPSFKTVSKQQQKKALNFLLNELKDLSWLDARETLKEFPIRTSVAMQMEDAIIDGILSRCGAVAICSGKATSAPYTQKEYLADIERFVWAPTRAGRTLTETEMRLQMNYLTKLIEGSVAGVAKNATRKGIADMYAHIEVPEWLKAASRERFGIISEEFMGCFNNKPREMQAARLEEISGFDDDVDLKAPIEPMEHIYYGELKKVRSLVAASASTGSADTQRHYRLLLYKIDQALK